MNLAVRQFEHIEDLRIGNQRLVDTPGRFHEFGGLHLVFNDERKVARQWHEIGELQSRFGRAF